MSGKQVVVLVLLSFFISGINAQGQNVEKHLDKKALYPRYREWASPIDSKIVNTNPAVLLWPAATNKKASYKVRLSQSRTFPKGKTLESTEIQWAMYTTHKKMNAGKWFWQYGVVTPSGIEWSDVYNFVITNETPIFETPSIDEFLKDCSPAHPRLYVTQSEIADFRMRNTDNAEILNIIRKANKELNAALPIEAPTRPRDTTGMSKSQKDVMMNFMYHRFGDKVKEPIKNLSMAYLFTNEKKYAETALKQALNLANINPKGYATREDFNASSVMLAMAVAYDTSYDISTPDEKRILLKAIKERGEKFFNKYANEFETHSMDNHVWQHTLRRLCFASIAVLNDLPEAKEWLAYCYEVWCCRFPILGEQDGGWHDGTSYFQVNFETFIYMPFMFKRFTGIDFFDIPYYRNLSKFLIYSYPKDSYSTGFGDNAENQNKPGKNFSSFADALAREVHDPYARWYSDQINEDKNENESANFTFYRLMTQNKADDVKPRSPKDLPQSLLFKDAGFALMHNDVTDTANDVMISFMDLPFGSTGHAHAAHNGFAINVGGKQLFGGTGHYSNFADKHTLMHYRTRGHNTILADGMAQTIGENGYGWIARFKNTPALTYVLGDATNAYGQMTTPFWIDRMRQFDVEYTQKNGFGDPEITRFRRHLVFLRPNIVVIYDELKAKKPMEWTWLLHSYNKLEKGDKENVVWGQNEVTTSRVDIFTTQAVKNYITNEFFSPAINWKSRGGSEKEEAYDYAKHWHLELSTLPKSASTRFLTIIQLEKNNATKTLHSPETGKDSDWTIGDWTIQAELNGEKAPTLVIKNKKGDAVEYINQGKTVVSQSGKVVARLIDELPNIAK